MAVDESMRKLKVPPKFLPYLEKHRIYETFYMLAEMLVMTKPYDHICFLKNAVQDVCRMRDNLRIVLIAPPQLDKLNIARMIADKTGVCMLSRHIIYKEKGMTSNPEYFAQRTAETVFMADNPKKNGWILVDFPDTAEEAKLLLKQGILPTHTFMFLPSDNIEHLKSCEMPEWDYKEFKSTLEEYKRSSIDLKYLYRTTLNVVNTTGKTIKQVGDMCTDIIFKKSPYRGAPSLWRVVLLGLRGSRRRTIAKMLSKKYGLIHVNMDEIINQAGAEESTLGDEIRSLNLHGVSIHPSIFLQLLKDRLLKEDCLSHGYVLTTFPRDTADFQMLDSYDARPNRIIYLKVSIEECLERIKDHCVNMYTGEILSRKAIMGNQVLEKQVMTHPADETYKVICEHENMNESVIQEILAYCGTDCTTVDASGELGAVCERVESVLMNTVPLVTPESEEQHHTKLKKQFLYDEQLLEAPADDEINMDKMYRRFLKLKRTEYPGPSDPVNVTELLAELSFDDRWEILEKYRLSKLVFNDNDVIHIFKHDDNTFASDD